MMKKTEVGFIVLAVGLVSLSGCASIISKVEYPIKLSSDPNQASVSVVSKKGSEVYVGVTPTIALLKATDGPYTVTISKAGHPEATVEIERTLDGWYFGNILFGGLIGLVIDPITGAMWSLEPQEVHVSLTDMTSSLDDKDAQPLSLSLLEETPLKSEDRLVRIEAATVVNSE